MKTILKLMLITLLLGILVGYALVKSGKVDLTTDYVSTVPDKFLASKQEKVIDSNFVQVLSCDGKEQYRIPAISAEYDKKTKQIFIREMFTKRDLQFDGKKYEMITTGSLTSRVDGCDGDLLGAAKSYMSKLINK